MKRFEKLVIALLSAIAIMICITTVEVVTLVRNGFSMEITSLADMADGLTK